MHATARQRPAARRAVERPAAARVELPLAAGNRAVTAIAQARGRRRIDRAVAPQKRDDRADDFGTFDYSFNWVCSEPHLDGYIVQRVERSESVGDAEPVRATYWEAWEVRGGEVLGPGSQPLGAAAHDSWVNSHASYGTSGEWSMKGTVYWLTPEQWAEIGRAFKPGGVDAAGELLSTASDPGISGQPLLTQSKGRAWDSRTVQAACNLLARWREDGMLALDANGRIADEEAAAAELHEDYGFRPETATEAVKAFKA